MVMLPVNPGRDIENTSGVEFFSLLRGHVRQQAEIILSSAFWPGGKPSRFSGVAAGCASNQQAQSEADMGLSPCYGRSIP